MASNPVETVTLPAGNFFPDVTPPTIVSFSVNINTSTLTLVFDEVVNASSLEPTAVRLQNASTLPPASYIDLTGGYTVSMNGLVVVIQITRGDLNEIKRLEDLLVSADTSFLSVTSDLIRDMNSNPVVAIPTSNALPIATFTNDTTRPLILGFDLDMDRGILSIYFLETINSFSVDYSCITLQSNFFGTISHTLTGGVLLMPYRPGELSFGGSESASGSGSLVSGSGDTSAFSGSGNTTDAPSNLNIYTPEFGSSELFDQYVVLTDMESRRDTTVIFVNITHR